VGEADIIVNNAGYFPNRPIEELDLPKWRKTWTHTSQARNTSCPR